MPDAHYHYGLGRRKRAIATARIFSGKGPTTVNDVTAEEYFNNQTLVAELARPLAMTGNADKLHASIKVVGGGKRGQAEAGRLAIARALVKRAPLYVFDDSFSALDFRTDAQLRAALRRELTSATVIIVAQRVGTILNADRIVVLDEGRVVGVGTHAELMVSSETYREIVFSQLSPEEAQAA